MAGGRRKRIHFPTNSCTPHEGPPGGHGSLQCPQHPSLEPEQTTHPMGATVVWGPPPSLITASSHSCFPHPVCTLPTPGAPQHLQQARLVPLRA